MSNEGTAPIYRADEPLAYRPQTLNERLDMIERDLTAIRAAQERDRREQEKRLVRLEIRLVAGMSVLSVVANAAAALLRQ